jgi:DNA-binding MarR family transcriptional regulator
MKNISEFMACDPSNITSIVEQLVNEGLVERKEASYDRRVKTLTLTHKGVQLREELLDIIIKTRLPKLCNLSGNEVDHLVSFLEKASGLCASDNIGLTADLVV